LAFSIMPSLLFWSPELFRAALSRELRLDADRLVLLSSILNGRLTLFS